MEREPRAAPTRLYASNPVVRVACGPEGAHALDLAGEPAPPLVLGVGELRSLGHKEELPLGPVVFLHGAVQVEVVAGQVREECPGEARARDAPEGETVRGDLHDDPAHPGGQHRGERALHLRGLRGCPDGRAADAARDRLGRRREAALPLAEGAGEDGVERVRGGGLAVGSRYAVDLHAPRGVAVDLPGEGGQGGTGVGDDGRRDTRDRALGHDEGGPAPYGLGGEPRPVALETGDRDKGEARLDGARVVRHPHDPPHPRRNVGAQDPG